MKKRFLVSFLLLLCLCITLALLSACKDDGKTDTPTPEESPTPTPSPEPIIYTVTFDSDGGSTVPAQSVTENGKIAAPTEPTKEGYSFDGWLYLGEPWDFSNDTVISDVILRANWKKLTFTASFYNGQELHATVEFSYGDTELSSIPAVPKKNGYNGTWESFTLNNENITVYASYELITYRIIYNNTKGALNTNPAEYTILSEMIILNELEMEGFEFDGWYDDNGRLVTNIPSGSTKDFILDAHWKYKNTVTFDIDGIKTTEKITNGSKIPKPTANPNKDYYNFDGWYYGSRPWNFDTDIVTDDITLVAKWTPIDYKAKFYVNGILHDTVTFTVEDSALQRVPAVPNKNGYLGVWESYTLDTKDIEIKAIYTPIIYTITYNNLNDCTHNNPTTYTVITDTLTLAPLNREDSVFEGWFDDDGNKIYEITKGSYGHLNLTARWTKKCSVAFNSDGGSNVESQLIAPGEKSSKPQDPTKSHYRFDGWLYLGEPWNFDTDVVIDNITLVAKWTPIQYEAKFYVDGILHDTVTFTVADSALSRVPEVPNKNGYTCKWEDCSLKLGGFEVNAVYTIIPYTITYTNLNGATHTNTTEYNVESNTITLLAPTQRAGYKFLGWYNKSTQTEITEIPNGSYGSLELEAKWQLETYTITYNELNGATNENPASYNVESSTVILVPLSLNGYTFLGWQDESGNTVTQIPTGSTGNITLTAVWGIYTVTTNTNIAGGGEYTQLNNQTTTSGQSITLTAKTNLGYKFLGWYDGNVQLTANKSYTFDMPSNSLTYTAKYELKKDMQLFIFTSNESECVITGCNDLTSVSISIPSYVTLIKTGAFKGCMSLSSVVIKSQNTVIEDNAFWTCIYLSQINVNGTNIPIKTCYTWNEYNNMDSKAQQDYYNSFLTYSDFFTWKNKAIADDDEAQNREEIGNGDNIELN